MGVIQAQLNNVGEVPRLKLTGQVVVEAETNRLPIIENGVTLQLIRYYRIIRIRRIVCGCIAHIEILMHERE